jgi:N-glycosylase/DNA lyase
MTSAGYLALDEIFTAHRRSRKAIRARLQEFAAVPPEDLFYELAYCLLTPQSSAEHADRAVQALREAGFRERGFDPTAILRRPEAYIRFHNTKARRLLEVRVQFPDIDGVVQTGRCASGGHETEGPRVRLWLVQHVRGLGMKEASHYLRNIGYRNLAILDRHILRNLTHHCVLRSVPATMTIRRYLRIEDRFRMFAKVTGIPMDELDLLFWSKETGEIRK